MRTALFLSGCSGLDGGDDDDDDNNNNRNNIISIQTWKAFKNMTTENGLCKTLRVLSTASIIPNKLHESSELPSLLPGLYILIQRAVILNTCRTGRRFLAEHWIRSSGQWERYCFENEVNCCEVRNDDDDDDDDDDDNDEVEYKQKWQQ